MTGTAPHPAATLVDDDDDARAAAAQLLALSGFAVRAFADPRAALAAMDADYAGILVTDVRMPGMSGIELFRAVHERDRELPVILVTGHGDVATAVAALKAGAWDFITKPFEPDALVLAASRAAAQRALVLENRALRREAERSVAGKLIGETPAVKRLNALLPTLADAAIDVAILGASGTGKTHYGRALHRAGRRARHRFSVIDCATVPAALIERELFGHGGPIAQAHRGTLLLRGLDRASGMLQDGLARFAEERAVALDTRTPATVDVRIVATLSEEGRDAIRPALYHRIAVAPLRIPPLSERRDDIPLLFATFVHRIAERARIAPPPLGDLPHRLRNREWPGNVRELDNHAERFVLGLEGGGSGQAEAGATLPEQLQAFERSLIVDAFDAARFDATRAARILGLPRKTFYNRVAALAIDLAALRARGGRGSAGGRPDPAAA